MAYAELAVSLDKKPRPVVTTRLRGIWLRREQVAVLGIILVPCLGPLGALYLGLHHGISVMAISLLCLFYLVTMFGTTCGYHRLFSHRSFEAKPPLKWVLGILGSMALQGPILRWTADHRRHHVYSDRVGDPHSPHVGEGSFWSKAYHAHMGWMFAAEKTKVRHFVLDLVKDPTVVVIDRLYPLWMLLSVLLPPLFAFFWTRTAFGALEGFVWGSLLRVFVGHHITWCVNSVCHLWGKQAFISKDQSLNNALVSVLTLGEGWHNNHHAFPGSFRHGVLPGQFDVVARCLTIFERFGWVCKLKRISQAQIDGSLQHVPQSSPCRGSIAKPLSVGAAYSMSRNDYDGVMLHLNENLFCRPQSVEQVLTGEFHRYPISGDHVLRTAASRAFELSPTEVFSAAGSSHALCMLILRFAPTYKKLIVPSPTWNYYQACAQSLDVDIIDVPLQRKGTRYFYNIAALDAAMHKEGPALVILATPNNPTGNTLSYDCISLLATNHPDSTIIVDEAYFGFHDVSHQQPAALLREHDNVVIIRSLSKAYGLAGLRVGFALASGAIRDAIAPYFLPFGLPEDVQKVAATRLLDKVFLKSVSAACMEAQKVLRDSLAGVVGFTVYRSHANFCLVQVPPGMANRLAERLEDKGFIIKSLGESQIRITMAPPDIMRDVARILTHSSAG